MYKRGAIACVAFAKSLACDCSSRDSFVISVQCHRGALHDSVRLRVGEGVLFSFRQRNLVSRGIVWLHNLHFTA